MLLRHVFMLDDTQHSIALGTAVGMVLGMTPTVGIQMILVMVFALLVRRLFRFNRVAALITVYISNPLTVVPIYWFHYKVGAIFIKCDKVTMEQFAKILEYHNLSQWRQTIYKLFVDVGSPLIVGSLVVATVLGAATYPIMRGLLRSFHRRKPGMPKPRKKEEAVAAATEPK